MLLVVVALFIGGVVCIGALHILQEIVSWQDRRRIRRLRAEFVSYLGTLGLPAEEQSRRLALFDHQSEHQGLGYGVDITKIM